MTMILPPPSLSALALFPLTKSAVARAFPLYSSASRKRPAGAPSSPAPLPSRNVTVYLRVPHDSWPAVRMDVAAAAEGIQLAARLVDTPPNVLHTSAFIEEAMAVARGLGVGVTMKVIRGDDLARQGFGGLYGVGKAAVEPPALVVLSHVVDEKEERERKRTIDSSMGTGDGDGVCGGGGGGISGRLTGQRRGQRQPGSVCFVGKGIVYDTGGLSIKTKTGMVGSINSRPIFLFFSGTCAFHVLWNESEYVYKYVADAHFYARTHINIALVPGVFYEQCCVLLLAHLQPSRGEPARFFVDANL